MTREPGTYGAGTRVGTDTGTCGCGPAGGCAAGTCGTDQPCCTGVQVETPQTARSAPGQPALAFRTGTHGQFLASMQARMSGPAYPALSGLTARGIEDPALTLLDGAASLADVLAFHTERIADEGFLRTATDDDSLRLLTGLLGYRTRPGLAAQTYLAFTVDADPTATDTISLVPAGTQARSQPEPGKEPQAFETLDDLPVRASWNRLPIRLREPVQVLGSAGSGGSLGLTLAGTATALTPGEAVLLGLQVKDPTGTAVQQTLAVVVAAHPDPVAQLTNVTVQLRPRPAMAATVAARLSELIAATEAGDLPDRSRIVRRFLDEQLIPARNALAAQVSAAQVSAARVDVTALPDPFPALLSAVEAASVQARSYPAIAAWFDATATGLRALARTMAGAAALPVAGDPGPAAPAPRAGAFGLEVRGAAYTGQDGEDGDGSDPALDGLAAMLQYLRLRPEATPTSSRVMPRDPARIFGPGSDLAPRLIAALDPAVADGMFAAWRGLVAPSDQAQDAVRALRLTAAPFAATAPRRTRIDNGEVVQLGDWPLRERQTLTCALTYDAGRATQADLAFHGDGEPVEAPLPLTTPGTTEVGLGPWTARATVPASQADPATPSDDPVLLTLTRAGQTTPAHTLSVPVRAAGESAISVTVTGEAGGAGMTFSLEALESQTQENGDWQLRADRNAGDPSTIVELRFSTVGARHVLALDARYDGIGVGSWVVVERPRKGVPGGIPGDLGLSQVIAQVAAVDTEVVTGYGLSAQVTVLTLDRDWLDLDDTSLADVRDARVRARSQPLALATRPLTTVVAGDELELAGLVEGLAPGRWISVAGERTDLPGISGVTGSEVAMIAGVRHVVDGAVPGDNVRTVLRLLRPLKFRYERPTVQVAGNVTRASAGATRNEILGSGDAARAGQSFTLLQHPVTWVSADTPTGAASTLRVFVDGELWREVDSFAGYGPRDRVHITQVLSDGRVVVRFGDGVQGARLPTGVENVRARYRVGLGAGGNVAPHRINQLVTRPPAVSGVDNPVRATGGAEPDTPARARRDAPLAVTALDRLVGLRDYEDFARRWAGIGRARATRIVTGGREQVHVTLAGVGDAALAADSAGVVNLRSALLAYGEPRVPVTVAVRETQLLVLALRVAVDADHAFDLLEPVLRAGLLARLGFDARELAQPVYVSEILAAAQAVPGVDHVTVEVLTTVTDADPVGSVRRLAATWGDPNRPKPGVEDQPAHAARPGPGGTVLPAQLLYLSADVTDTLILTEVRS